MHTPWGHADYAEQIAEGLVVVRTPSHGGLRLSAERWSELPEDVTATFSLTRWAEEDCEAPIAIALLGVDPRPHLSWGPEEFAAHARRIASHYELYAPALAHLPAAEPARDGPEAASLS